MKQLIVAATARQITELKELLPDATAGRWERRVQLVELSENKTANDKALRDASHKYPGADCFADKNVTSRSLEDNGFTRMTKAELTNKTLAWLHEQRISWRSNVDECRRHGSYKWLDVDLWRHQFERIDPVIGPRVAIAILAQLQIIGTQELGEFLTGELDEVSHSTYFLGADPHSGDHGVASMLHQLINNKKLSEAFKLPMLGPASRIRMFNDAGWSGGESSRRLKCLYRNCDRKACHIESSQFLEMRFAFITDIAEEEIQGSINQIECDLNFNRGSITLSYPLNHRLSVKNDTENAFGLAFRDIDISTYVSPADMRNLCYRIGKKIASRRPLGTNNIASTIGFWHSLPKAMLPILIVGGGPIKDSKGNQFSWRPLIVSQHVLNPQRDTPGYHCSDCPLAQNNSVKEVGTTANSSPI